MKLYSRTNPESEAIRDLMDNIPRRLPRGASFFLPSAFNQPRSGLVIVAVQTRSPEGFYRVAVMV